jgi:hypothetical protein
MHDDTNIQGGRPIPSFSQKTRATAERRTKTGRFYKPLPTEFRAGGFCFRQIAREGNAAIYEQTSASCSEPSVCYKVIRIRRRDGIEIAGKFIEPHEVYPNSEAWGADGFTLTDKEAAFAKLEEVRG